MNELEEQSQAEDRGSLHWHGRRLDYMQTKKTLLLLSGGLDSVAMLYYLRATGEIVEALHIDYGSNHSRKERKWAHWHCEETGTPWNVVQLPKLLGSKLTGGQGTWVVPGRNAILLAHAANHAEATGCAFVAYACNQDDAEGFPDCRPEWIGAFNQQLAASEIKCRVVTPFVSLTKRQLVQFTLKVKPDAPVEQSWSCYNDTHEPCGECPACEKRKAALE